jgi:hypothetical protein
MHNRSEKYSTTTRASQALNKLCVQLQDLEDAKMIEEALEQYPCLEDLTILEQLDETHGMFLLPGL